MLDVEALRAATPLCAERIHLNHAGAAPMSRATLGAVTDHLTLESRIGGYEAARAADDAVRTTIHRLAVLLGVDAAGIAVMPNATTAWTTAFWSVPWRGGDRVVVTESEYGSNLLAILSAAERLDLVVDRIGVDDDGNLDLEALDAAVTRGPRLVSLVHMPGNGGIVQPVAEAARRCRACDAVVLLDASQTLGQLSVARPALDWDVLVAPGRKYLRGPRGTAVLAARSELLDRLAPLAPDIGGAELVGTDGFHLADTARRLETWERSVAAQLGLGNAVAEALDIGVDAMWARTQTMADRLRHELTEAGFTIHDLGTTRGGIVTTSSPDTSAEDLVAALTRRDINASVSVASAAPFDAARRDLPPMVRLSVSHLTIDDEIDAAVAALAQADQRR